MGQSTDALMAFGIDLGEDLPDSFQGEYEEDGFEPDAFLIQDYNIHLPEWTPGLGAEYWRAKEAAIATIPVELVMHCSGDYAMYFLAIRGTHQRAGRGHPIEAVQRSIEPLEIEALHAFCNKHGIEWEEPKWQIFSLWF